MRENTAQIKGMNGQTWTEGEEGYLGGNVDNLAPLKT